MTGTSDIGGIIRIEHPISPIIYFAAEIQKFRVLNSVVIYIEIRLS